MLNRVTTGAASYANPQTAFHRQDGGVNALIGIRAARSAYVRRPDADAGSVIWQPPTGAGATAAKRPTPAQAAIAAATQSTVAAQAATAKIAEASGGQGAKDKLHPGLSVALDVLESSEEGRELLAKIKASDSGIDIWYNDSTGRDYVYMRGFEKDYYDVHDRVWERTYGKTAQPAAVVDISDEGRELAAKMSEAKPVLEAVFKFVPDGDNSFKIVKDDSPSSSKAKNFFENEVATAIAKSKTNTLNSINYSMDPVMAASRYEDNTLGSIIMSNLTNYGVDSYTAFTLSVKLGNLLQGPANTIEERVVNREKGLELAKHIAENYIDDPTAKQTFLDRAKEVAKYAELQDKGYLVLRTADADGGYSGYSATKIDDGLLVMDGKPTEKQATATIERVKKSLDMNAVKQDALDIFKKILANNIS